MRRVGTLFILAACLSAQNNKIGQISSADILSALEQATQWYRNVSGLQQSNSGTVDVLLRENTQQNALRALQLAFDFSRAEAAYKAALKEPAADANPDDGSAATAAPSEDMAQVAVSAAARVTRIEGQIADVESALAKAPSAKRATLEAQRDELNAELALAKEIQKSVQAIASFVGTNNSGNGAAGKLAGEINDLERTVPEARRNQQQQSTPVTHAAPAVALHPEATGIVGLISQVFALGKVRGDLAGLTGETDALLKKLDAMRTPVLGTVRESVKQADALAAASSADTIDQLNQGRKDVTALTARFKLLSTVLVPLREEQILVESTRGNLVEWRNVINQQYDSSVRYLLLRLGGLLVAIFVVLLASAIWQRATLRYIREPRRKRQFQLIRRIVVSAIIAILLILAFVTEFGSVATYAGFLTAGLALALQNVILSVVAYFFLIGRYGIRTGDRVTIAGVNGEVIEMGLVRMYLMEQTGAGDDVHPTGRVVVFSNSVLFQPQAIYKQLPGTDYLWHTVTVVMTPDSNFDVAETTLTKAVESVYEEYRPAIEQQHAEFEKSVDVEMTAPRPECHLRFTDAGLEFRARYPVEFKGARDTDSRVMKALYDAVAQTKDLTVAPDGAPKLQPA
jgi:small-conductance mechanosensitive channel